MIFPVLESSVRLYHEPVVNFWECVHDGWPALCYSEELVSGIMSVMDRLERTYQQKVTHILDLGAGVGNPSIGLAKRGYKVVAVDKDPEMVRRFQQNAAREGVRVPLIHRDWTTLLIGDGKHMIEPSSCDFALCRGNSLIYAASWETGDFIESAAIATILSSLRNMFNALRPGGFLYIDISSRSEYETGRHFEFIGPRESQESIINVYWFVRYAHREHKRIVEAFRVFHNRKTLQAERICHHTFVSFHLHHSKLIRLCKTVGFQCIEEYTSVDGERHYDVFLFRKPTNR